MKEIKTKFGRVVFQSWEDYSYTFNFRSVVTLERDYFEFLFCFCEKRYRFAVEFPSYVPF